MYPYDESESEAETDAGKRDALTRLVQDPLYWREQDPEFRAYVDNGFKAVYGDEEAERDATGRLVDPAPKPVTLPPFKPSISADDMSLAGGVGENQPNRWRDVWTVQKGLANTGYYPLDLNNEESGAHSPALDRAIRDFQREKRETIDGTLLPGGPTITRLKESLFGESASRVGTPPKGAANSETPIAKWATTDNDDVQRLTGSRYGRARQHQMLPVLPDRPIDDVDVIPVQQHGPAQSDQRIGPRLYTGSDRQRSILEDGPGHIIVAENPNARAEAPSYASHAAGRRAVLNHDEIIKREAARFGVDPDLVRAIMYVENAQGNYVGGGRLFERLGLAKSILPMNIRHDPWKRLGFSEDDLRNPEMNVRAGILLLRRIQDRLRDPTVAKIATLYWSLPQDQVMDYGARVADVYRTKAWSKPGSHAPRPRYSHPVDVPPMP